MNTVQIPSAFVFTKMQTDAGESINAIRNRKELERMAGGGSFWWGVGELKGSAVADLRRIEPNPQVLFALAISAPSRNSTDPGEVLMWRKFVSSKGAHDLPQNVVVTSGALTRSGTPKTKYFALVCTAEASILRNGGGTVDAGRMVNLGAEGRPIGASQTTATVKYFLANRAMPPRYDVAARALLREPYFVNLAAPRKLSRAERDLLYEVGQDGKTIADWQFVVHQLKGE